MFTLPNLSYAYDALAPYIDAKTMEIHLNKHHQAYVDNLNKIIAMHPDLKHWNLNELMINLDRLPESIQAGVRNNGGGHWNHSLFWEMMAPNASMCTGLLEQEINKTFQSMQQFKDQFSLAAKNRFGSGWAWLVLNQKGNLEIYSTANQDNPLMQGHVVLLGLDVWEHAYYLHYQNRRADYIEAWWHVVNWSFLEERYRTIIGK